MAPSILKEGISDKQAMNQDAPAQTRIDVEVAPPMASALPKPSPLPETGAPSAHIDASVSVAPAERAMAHTVGAAKLSSAESAIGASPPSNRPSEQRAVDAIVANIGSSDGLPVSAAVAAPQAQATAVREAYHVDAPAFDRATQHIVANISDRSTDSRVAAASRSSDFAAAAQAPSREASTGSSAARSAAAVGASDSSTMAHRDVNQADASYAKLAGTQGPSRALSASYAEGMEMLSSQAMLMRADDMLSDLQALVDAYAALQEDIDLQAPLSGRQLDKKTLMLLAQQAKHTDLGKVHPDSAVYVLTTVPQTIIEDHLAAQRYSIFNMAGELVGQIDHADAHLFGLDLGGGRAGALGPGGFLTSFHLHGAHNRTIISALGGSKILAGAANSRAKIDRKVTRISSTGTAFNEAGDCAKSCFMHTGAEGDKDGDARPGRCVLCRHQQP